MKIDSKERKRKRRRELMRKLREDVCRDSWKSWKTKKTLMSMRGDRRMKKLLRSSKRDSLQMMKVTGSMEIGQMRNLIEMMATNQTQKWLLLNALTNLVVKELNQETNLPRVLRPLMKKI